MFCSVAVSLGGFHTHKVILGCRRLNASESSQTLMRNVDFILFSLLWHEVLCTSCNRNFLLSSGQTFIVGKVDKYFLLPYLFNAATVYNTTVIISSPFLMSVYLCKGKGVTNSHTPSFRFDHRRVCTAHAPNNDHLPSLHQDGWSTGGFFRELTLYSFTNCAWLHLENAQKTAGNCFSFEILGTLVRAQCDTPTGDHASAGRKICSSPLSFYLPCSTFYIILRYSRHTSRTQLQTHLTSSLYKHLIK